MEQGFRLRPPGPQTNQSVGDASVPFLWSLRSEVGLILSSLSIHICSNSSRWKDKDDFKQFESKDGVRAGRVELA